MDRTFTASATIGDTMCLTVMITNDEIIECDETFFVTLSGDQMGQTTVTIQDSDGMLP